MRPSLAHQRLLLVGALSGLLSCGGNAPTNPLGGGSSCTPTSNQVCMVNLAFNPSNLTIARGTTVTWKNGDAISHTVGNATGSADLYTSGFIGQSETFSHTFATAGTFQYYCALHGADGNPPTGMHGSITVN